MRSFFLLKISICLLFSMSVQAHDKKGRFDVNEAIRGADFIVQTSVKEVNYAISAGGPNAEMLPHTFVTFQIQKILKGNPRQANEFTLRFLGGRGDQSTFLHPSNYPLFDIGDQDILFIKGNTVKSCPLHRCEIGRFRSIKGLMYNDHGHQIVSTRLAPVGFGKFQPLDEVMTHRVSQTVLYLKEGSSESEGPPETELPVGKQFTLESFSTFIEGKVKGIYPPDVLDKWPLIPSADRRVSFIVKPVREIKAKSRIEVPFKPIVPPNESDRIEEEEFRKNQGNPVIKR